MTRRQRNRQGKRRTHASRRSHRSLVAAGIGVGGVLAMPPGAQAAVDTITVDSPADDGSGGTTLREAIVAANDNDAPDQDVIVFHPSITGTITLNGNQLPQIDEPLSIDGPGASMLAVSGAMTSRIFYINTTAGDNVTIDGLTLTAGKPPTSYNGGALYTIAADLTITSSDLTGNSVNGGVGGAITAGAPGTVTLQRSTISGNSTSGNMPGGGIYSLSALTLQKSTVSGNMTAGADAGGGGIYFTSSVGGLLVENSTISANTTSGASAHGGGIYSNGSGLTFRNATVSGNQASGLMAYGGGIHSKNHTPDPVLINTIVANNSAGSTGPLGDDLANPTDLITSTFTLIETTPFGSIMESPTGSSLLGVDPQLGGLAANGGSTMTHRPAATSPVVDKGIASGGPSIDQRDMTRPVDIAALSNSAAAGSDGADMGSVELTPAEATPPTPPAGAGGSDPPIATGKRAAALKKCKKKKSTKAKRKCRRKAKRLPL